MKNFTNNFKQFTSRLSARWLIMALMLLVGTSSAWANGFWGENAWNIKFYSPSQGKDIWINDNYDAGHSSGSTIDLGTFSSAPYLKGYWAKTWGYGNDTDKFVMITFNNSTTNDGVSKQWDSNGDQMWKSESLNIKFPDTEGSHEESITFAINGAETMTCKIKYNICASCCTNYYLQHPWNGGNWTWKELKKEDCNNNIYTLTANYGNAGCDYSKPGVQEKQDYIANPILEGNPVKGDECIFTFDANNKTITITKVVTCENPTAGNFTYTAPQNLVYNNETKAATVVWNETQGGTITVKYSSSSTKYTLAEPKDVGTYYVYVTTTEANGMCGVTDLYIEKSFTITKANQTTPTITANSTNICGNEATFAVSGGESTGNYSYTLDKNDATATLEGTTLKATQSGSVTLKVKKLGDTNYNDSDEAVVEFNFTMPIENVTLSKVEDDKTTYCVGDRVEFKLNYNGPYPTSYEWSGSAMGSLEATGKTANVLDNGASWYINFTEAKTYTIALSLTGCNNTQVSKELSFTVNALPGAPTLSPNTDEVCSGKEFTLPGDYNWYEISTGGTKLNSATISGGITSNKSYWAEAKNASGCVSSTRTEYTLTVNDKPAVPTLSADKTSLIGDENAVFTVGNTVAGLTYTLYNGNTSGESQVSNGSGLTFKAGDAGSYTVKVTNTCGTSTSTPAVVITVCTPQTNEFRHANSSYTQLANQPTYYPGDKVYFVSTNNCCLTGTWSANLQKGEEAWYTGLTGGTPRFYMTLTRAGNFTITNMATNGCTQDKNVKVNLDFTITALSEVTNANGTASGADIALTWKHSTNHTKVMVVRYPTAGTETIPAGGQSYSEGNTLGEGTVVYVGTSESYTDKSLPSGESYKYYFYTVNNNYYSEGVVLSMSSCPTPAKPSLSSTAITACNGECTAQGYITINNMNDYKDDTYTFELGSSVVTPDANGRLGINSTAYTQYTVTVTNSCGNPNSATVDIAINDNKPTITGATYTQPGKSNAITLTAANGILADWSVDNGGDLSKTSKSNTTEFSAEENGTYIITADNKGCTDTHVVTVSDAFYIWVRNAKENETAYSNFYYPDQNSPEYRGGEMFYAECEKLPTNGNTSLETHYTHYNEGGREADLVQNDCDGYTWYGFRASADVISGAKYFYVHAKNDKNKAGFYTHTVPTKVTLTSDVYYRLGDTHYNDETNKGYYGWKIVSASAPYSGPVVHASGNDFSFNKNNFADFVALYVTDCSGKEVKSYQWQYSATENGKYDNYSSVCTYVGKKSEQGDAGKTNNIRPNVAGWYRCTATYTDGSSLTSAAKQVTATSGTSYSFTSDLPIIMVNTNGYGFPSCDGLSGTASKNADVLKAKISVDVKIKLGNDIVYDRKARMNYRGSSSLNFVKKSYAFCPGKADCVEDKGRVDYVKTEKLNMLNVGSAVDKDWVLYAAAADPSIMRNRLVFDTFRDMTGSWSVQSRYVELIVDGEYKGIYVFMDKITNNENRVNIDDSKGGFILKFDKTDIVDRYEGSGDKKTFKSLYSGKDGSGTYDTQIDQRFEIEYPEMEDVEEEEAGKWATTVNNIKSMINNFETQLKAGNYAEVQKIIDYKSWADWFIITEYAKNMDAYRASCLFVYNGDKLEARPLWDQELSFKNYCATLCDDYSCDNAEGLLIRTSKIYEDTESCSAPFWFTGKYVQGRGTEAIGGSQQFVGYLLNDPCFVQTVKDRWNEHKNKALSAESLNAKLERYTNEMATALDREKSIWKSEGGKLSRETCQCSYNGTTGYSDIKISESKGDITEWINARPSELEEALKDEIGTGLSISFSEENINTTPWEPVVLQVHNESGYNYTLTYTDNALDQQAGIIIEKNGDTYKYNIPRPANWGTGNEATEGERADIVYGLKATLQMDSSNVVCGSQAEVPFDEATITLQDEPNENCVQP